MACRVGLVADDCISDHWLPPFKGHAEPSGGRFPCPVCGCPRAVSVQVKNGRPAWNNHCECDRELVDAAISAKVPCYTKPGRHRGKPAADLEEIESLVLDRKVTINALRLGVLESLGWSTQKAAEKLKLPRRTFGDARRILAESRRSRGRRILATAEDPPVAKSRQKPQVERHGKAA